MKLWSRAYDFIFLTISPGDLDGYNEADMFWQDTDVT